MRINNQDVTKIGKGEFSTAYRVDNTDIVYIVTKTDSESNQNVKEIYTHIDKRHVPYMSTIDTEVYMPRIGYVNLYETRYYHPLTSSNTEAWKIYRTLQKTWDQVYRDNIHLVMMRGGNEYTQRHTICRNFIDTLEANESVPQSILDALGMIYTWSTAYGSGFLFEFPKSNLRVDNNGDLILLDIVFFRTPTEDRKAEQKRLQNRW